MNSSSAGNVREVVFSALRAMRTPAFAAAPDGSIAAHNEEFAHLGLESPDRAPTLQGLIQKAASEGSAAGPLQMESGELEALLVRLRLDAEDSILLGIAYPESEPCRDADSIGTAGTVSGEAIHEMNNALARIATQIELLMETNDAGAQRLSGVLDSIHAAAEHVRSLGGEASAAPGAPEYVDPNDAVRRALWRTEVLWKHKAAESGTEFLVSSDLRPVGPIRCSAEDLVEALADLVRFSIECMPQGGDLQVSTTEAEGRVIIEVDCITPTFSEKPGAECKRRLLAPALAKIEGMGGRLTGSSSEKGATHTIFLPVATAAEMPSPKSMPGAVGRGPEEDTAKTVGSVLLVEDEPSLRKLLAQVLRRDGHKVVEAATAEEAVDLCERDSFDVAVTDLGLSGKSGWHVVDHFRRAQSRVPIVLITGWTDQTTQEETRARGVFRTLTKPFSNKQLKAAVREAISVHKG